MWGDPIQPTDGDTVAAGGTVADGDTVAQRGIVAGKSSSETASRGLRRVQPHHTCRVRNHRCPDPSNHHRITSKSSRQSSKEQKPWATGEEGGHSGRPATWGPTTYQHRAPTATGQSFCGRAGHPKCQCQQKRGTQQPRSTTTASGTGKAVREGERIATLPSHYHSRTVLQLGPVNAM